MSTTIDNKVVSMSFDNKNFEKNVNETMSTLDKFKQKLNFDKSVKGFDELDKAAQKVRFDTMEHGIEKVKMKLSALDVFAVTAFHRISDAAITTGKNMVKAFTIDPVKTGLQEYETQINAVQTILANTKNKGSTIDDVNRALDELNTYADKTIYNFTEMTRNIGTFTAAGVGLKESTQAIKGIANLAAVSGSNAQQASTAMYQLSQALAAGKVSLQDWNSVVNAGMGGEVFQEALKRTSRVLGTGVDEAIKKYGTFRESLTKGAWLTTDVLTETLAQLSGAYTEADLISQGYTKKQAKEIADMAQTATDAATKVKTFTQLIDTLKEAAQSGWTQTWQLIIGDFEEAKALFTEASDYIGGIIGKSADDRNNLVKGAMQNVVSSDDWAKLKEAGVATKSFKNAIIETAEANGISIKKMIEDNGSFEKTLKTGWFNKDILTETLKKNEKQLSASTLKMSKSMKEYFKIADQVMKGSWGKGKQAQEALTKAGYDYAQVQKLVNGMTKYGAKEFEKMCLSQLKSEGVTKKQAKALTELAKEAKKTGTPINELMAKMERKSGRELLIDTIRNSALAIIKPFKAMKKAWQEIFPPKTSEELYNIINSIHEFSVKLLNFDKNGEKLTRTFKGLFSILSIFSTVIKTISSTAFKFVNDSSIVGHFLDLTANIGDLCVKLQEAITKSSKISEVFSNVGSVLGGVASKINEMMSLDTTKFSKNFSSISDIVSNVGKKIGSTASEIGSRFMDTLSTMFENFDANKLMNLLKAALESGVFLMITRFIQNVIKSIKDVTTSIDSVIKNISKVFDGLAKCLSSFQNKINSEALKNIAISMAILTASILLLSTIDPSKTSDVLSQLTVMFIELMAAMRILSKASQASGMYVTSLAMINMSISISVLASALNKLSEIKHKDIEKGLVAIGALMLELVAATKLMAMNGGKVAKGAVQMIIMSGAVKILASVCKDLGTLPMEQIKKGLIGVGGLLGELAVFMVIAGFSKKAVKSATSMLLLSASLKILASVCSDIAKIEESDVKKSVIAISALLAAFAVFENLSGRSKRLLRTSIVLSVATICLSSVANTLTKISKISVSGLQKSVGAISAVLFSIATITRIMPTSGLIDMSITLPSFASAIVLIGEAMKKISAIPFKKLAASLGAITIVIAEMAVTLRLIKGYGGASRVFVMTATAMTILATSLKILGSIGVIGAVTSIGLLASQMTVLGIASKLVKPMALLKLSGSITTFSLSLLALSAGVFGIGAGLSSMLIGLSAAFLTLSQLKFSTIGKGFAVIVGAFALLGVTAKLMKPLIPSLMSMSLAMASFGLSCIALGVSISLVIGSLTALSALGDDAAKSIVSSLETIIIGLLEMIPKITTKIIEAVVVLISGLCDGLIECAPKIVETLLYLVSEIISQLSNYAPSIIDNILSLVINVIDGLTARAPELLGSIANFIGAIVSCITTAVGQIDTSFMVKLVASTTLLIGMTVGLAKIKKNIASAMVSVLGISAIAIALSGIIVALSLLPVDKALPSALGLSVLLSAISVSLAIISKVGNVSKKSIVALYAISGAVAVLGVILGAMSALNVEPSIETASALSIMLLSMSAACGILSLIGPVSAGAMSGALALDGVILIIGGLMVGLGALVDKFPMMETFLNKGVSLLNGIASGIGEFVGNLIGGIGEGIMDHVPAIGESLAKFAENISGVDPSVAESAKALAETLVILGGAELVNAIASFASNIFGDSSMTGFGDQLKGFAQGIVDFSNVIEEGNVNGDKIKGVAEAVKKIVEISQMIPNSGGLLGSILGNNDIDDFGNQLKGFAQGIVDFSNVIEEGNVKSDKIECAADAVKKIIEIAQMIPNSGGLLGTIAGNNDIDDFGNKLSSFGQGIVDFSEVVEKGNVKSDKIEGAADAVKKIIEIAKMIPNSGGLLGSIAGNNDIDDFSNKLSSFGRGIVNFSEVVEKGNVKSDRISSTAEAIKKVIQISDMLTNSSIATISSKTIDNVCKNISKLTDITSLLKQVNGDNVNKLPKAFESLSKISISSFIDSFTNSSLKVKTSIKAFLSSVENTIRNEYSAFEQAGTHCVTGFITGITNKVNGGDIYGAGKKIGDEALRGARESLDIHSPSRKMKEVAKHTVDGFTNFMNTVGADKSKKSASNMMDEVGKTSVSSANKNTKKTSATVNKGIKTAGSSATQTAKKVSKDFLDKMSKELTKAKKKFKSVSNVSKLADSKMAKFVKSGSKATKVIKYANTVVNKFAKTYTSATKNATKNSSKAAKAVSNFTKRLYEESDAYKEDQSNLKNLLKTQKDYYKQKVKITEKLSKVKTEDQKKQLEKELKDVNKNINKTTKDIDKLGKSVEKNIKKTFNALKKSIKDSVKDYISVFNATKNTIDLFDSSVFDSMNLDSFTEMKYSISDSMSSIISVLDISLDTGLDIFGKFSDGAEDMASTVTQAEDEVAEATKELNDAQDELSKAQQDLAKAQAKSNSVFGRSQRYLDKVREAEEKLAEAQSKVEDATNNQAEAMNKLNALQTDTSVDDLLANMESNIKGVEDLRNKLDELGKRGIDEGLLKHLKSLGTSGMEQVSTFVKMTDEELKKAGEYFRNFSKLSSKNIVDGFKDKKNAMISWGDSITKFSALKLDSKVKEALLSEFQEKGVDSAEYINAILNMTEAELNEFNSDYLEILKTPDAVANEVINARKKLEEEEAKNKKKDTSGVDKYVATMKANIDAQKEYNNNIEKLREKAKKGLISEDFLKYLEDLGKDGSDIIAGFVNSSNDKLKEANSLYAESARMSGDSFVESFGNRISDAKKWEENIEKLTKLNIPAKLKEEIINQCKDQNIESNELLETILGLTPNQMNELVGKWKSGNKETTTIADGVIASMAKVSEEVNVKNSNKVVSNAKKVADDVLIITSKTGSKVGSVPGKTLDDMGNTIKKKTPEVKNTAKKVATSAMNTISSTMSASKSKNIGKKTCDGIAAGITNNTKTVKNAAYNLATVIVNTIKSKLSELNNISLMSGLSSYSSNGNKSMKKQSDSTMELMATTISKVANSSSNKSSKGSTLTPVLDMNTVSKNLSSSTLSLKAMAVNAATASSLAKGVNSRNVQNGSSISKNYDNSQHSIENHFNITGDNPKEIANEVSKIIQNQINRKSTTWA